LQTFEFIEEPLHWLALLEQKYYTGIFCKICRTVCPLQIHLL